MEDQNRTIKLMEKIIELQDKLDYRQDGLEERFNKKIDMLLQRIETFGSNLNEKYDKIMERLNKEQDQRNHNATREDVSAGEVIQQQQQQQQQQPQDVNIPDVNEDVSRVRQDFQIKTEFSDEEIEVPQHQGHQSAHQYVDHQPLRFVKPTNGRVRTYLRADRMIQPNIPTTSDRIGPQEASIDCDSDSMDADAEEDTDDEQTAGDAAPKRKEPKINQNNDAAAGQVAERRLYWRDFLNLCYEDGKLIYECNACDKSRSEHPSNVKKHINGQHLNCIQICEVCGHAVRSKNSLTYHLRRHHPEVRYDCIQCDYTGVLKSSLQYHIATVHEATQPQPDTSQPEIIDHNGQAIIQNGTPEVPNNKRWKDYVKAVTVDGKRMFGCTACDSLSQVRKYLREHVQGKHLNVVYACEQCGRQSRSKSGLIAHTKIKHPTVRFCCPRCPYTTVLSSSLAYHQTMKHLVPQPDEASTSNAATVDDIGRGHINETSTAK